MSFSTRKKLICAVLAALFVLTLSACDGNGGKPPIGNLTLEEYTSEVLDSAVFPKMGAIALENETVEISVDGAEQGYFMVRVKTEPKKTLKLGVSHGEETYYYDLPYDEDPYIFPLQFGSGQYKIVVYERVQGTSYSYFLGFKIDVELKDEYLPFLMPNQLITYSADSQAIIKGISLTYEAADDLGKVRAIFDYITDTIDYDTKKARQIIDNNVTGYIPNIDETLRTKKGICYDYAALFAAMLRANGIPAKLIMGYVDPGNEYHAWNMIYIRDVGWIDAEIYFDGKNWQLADSTFAASRGVRDAIYYPLYSY